MRDFFTTSSEKDRYFKISFDFRSVFENHFGFLLKGKVFPIFAVLFNNFNKLASSRERKKYIDTLSLQWKYLDIANPLNVKIIFMNQVFMDHIYGIIMGNKLKDPPLELLQRKIKTWVGRLYKHLIEKLKNVDYFNISRAKQIIHYRIKPFLKYFLNLSPVDLLYAYNIQILLSNSLTGFMDSELLKKANIQREDSFLEKLVYFTGLLGGKASLQRRSTKRVFFKLTKSLDHSVFRLI